jgi:hypothetical protein
MLENCIHRNIIRSFFLWNPLGLSPSSAASTDHLNTNRGRVDASRKPALLTWGICVVHSVRILFCLTRSRRLCVPRSVCGRKTLESEVSIGTSSIKVTHKPRAAAGGATLGRISAMNRWLLIGSMAALLVGSTGCMQHNLRGGGGGGCANGSCDNGCSSCGSSDCGGGCGINLSGRNSCSDGSCSDGSGMLGRLGGLCGLCGNSGCRAGGCQAGPLGWQQGGLDYSSHLQPGLLGHHAAANLNNRPFTPGPPSAQVGYPYYTVRGPRDFLASDPPTIGR